MQRIGRFAIGQRPTNPRGDAILKSDYKKLKFYAKLGCQLTRQDGDRMNMNGKMTKSGM